MNLTWWFIANLLKGRSPSCWEGLNIRKATPTSNQSRSDFSNHWHLAARPPLRRGADKTNFLIQRVDSMNLLGCTFCDPDSMNLLGCTFCDPDSMNLLGCTFCDPHSGLTSVDFQLLSPSWFPNLEPIQYKSHSPSYQIYINLHSRPLTSQAFTRPQGATPLGP